MIVRYTDKEFEDAKSTDRLALECEHCHKIFKRQKKEIKYELIHHRGGLKYCSYKCANENHYKRHKVNCEYCGKELEVKNTDYNRSESKHFFCNNSCAAKYNNSKRGSVSEETKKKTRESIIAYYKSIGIYDKENDYKTKHKKEKLKKPRSKYSKHICKVCGKEYYPSDKGATRTFCSQECLKEYRNNRKKYLSEETITKLSAAGRHSVDIQSESRRSKNEKLFCELCEKFFRNVRHNEPIFNGWDADIIIEDAKVAILWNGKWHYQKIKENHSVEQVQNRDRIKIQEIQKCGYKPYVIKDMGKFNQQFVESEFEKFIETI